MYSSFKSNLRTKSSEQLFNMISNKSSWSDEQFKLIIEEITNRGLSNDEVDGLRSEFGGVTSEVGEKDLLKDEFEKDMEIITEAEFREKENEKHHNLALVSGLIITFLFAFTLFGGFTLLGEMNRVFGAYFYVFINYIILIILWFFLLWGLFITKKYLFSIIANAGLVLFLVLMILVNY